MTARGAPAGYEVWPPAGSPCPSLWCWWISDEERAFQGASRVRLIGARCRGDGPRITVLRVAGQGWTRVAGAVPSWCPGTPVTPSRTGNGHVMDISCLSSEQSKSGRRWHPPPWEPWCCFHPAGQHGVEPLSCPRVSRPRCFLSVFPVPRLSPVCFCTLLSRLQLSLASPLSYLSRPSPCPTIQARSLVVLDTRLMKKEHDENTLSHITRLISPFPVSTPIAYPFSVLFLLVSSVFSCYSGELASCDGLGGTGCGLLVPPASGETNRPCLA